MNKISKKQLEELSRLAKRPDGDTDTSDAPELVSWDSAERSRFYRPIKKQVTLRIDEEVLV